MNMPCGIACIVSSFFSSEQNWSIFSVWNLAHSFVLEQICDSHLRESFFKPDVACKAISNTKLSLHKVQHNLGLGTLAKLGNETSNLKLGPCTSGKQNSWNVQLKNYVTSFECTQFQQLQSHRDLMPHLSCYTFGVLTHPLIKGKFSHNWRFWSPLWQQNCGNYDLLLLKMFGRHGKHNAALCAWVHKKTIWHCLLGEQPIMRMFLILCAKSKWGDMTLRNPAPQEHCKCLCLCERSSLLLASDMLASIVIPSPKWLSF